MNFTPLRIRTLKPGRDIPFSLYIFFKEQYLEYVKPGMSLDEDKFKKLKKQKISKFFILDQDEKAYQEFLDELINETLDDANASLDSKVDIVEGQAETALENLQDDPASEESFNMTRKAAQNLRKIVFENPEALKTIFGSDSESEPIIKHSLNVCVLSIKFAKAQKCTEEEIDFLSTAALMHDVGVVQLAEETQELFKKDKKEFTPQEFLAYYAHIKSAINVLSDRPYINNKIIELIENHAENRSGTGPNKLKKLTKPMEILSLINSYDRKIYTSGKTPAEAIQELSIDELGNYDLKMIQEFQKLLKTEGIV